MRRAVALVFALGAAAFAQDSLRGGESATPRGALVRLGRPSLTASAPPLGAVALSADGTLVAAADRHTLHVWSTRSGAERRLYLLDDVSALAFSPDGCALAATRADDEGVVFDLAGGDKPVIDHAACGGSPAWAPDSRLVALGGRVFSWPGAKLVRTFDVASVRQVFFGPRGLAFLLGGGSVMLGRVATGELTPFASGQGRVAAIDSAARLLAHPTHEGDIVLMDLARDAIAMRLEGHRDRLVDPLVFSWPRADQLATGDDHGCVKVWTTDGDTELPLRTTQAHASRIAGIAFDGSTIATIAEGDVEVKLFSARTGELFRRGHHGAVAALAYARDGRLASAGVDGTILIWSAGERSVALKARRRARPVALAFAPRGDTLAVACWDGSTRLVDAATGAELWCASETSDDASISVAFLPGGDRLVVGMLKGRIVVRDAKTGAPSGTLDGGDGAARISISIDGKLVAATNGILAPANESVNAFDVATRKRKELVFSNGVRRVAFAPDGTTILAVLASGVVELRDVRSTKAIRSFPTEAADAECLAVSPDGRLVAVSSSETVDVRELATGDVLLSGAGHRASITDLAFAPSGGELASASEDGSIIIWNTGVTKK